MKTAVAVAGLCVIDWKGALSCFSVLTEIFYIFTEFIGYTDMCICQH